jgi:AraC family transcriptional regulator
LRIQAALERLLIGDNDYGRIANDCGFADQAHLTRALKSRIGLTPAVAVDQLRGLAGNRDLSRW